MCRRLCETQGTAIIKSVSNSNSAALSIFATVPSAMAGCRAFFVSTREWAFGIDILFQMNFHLVDQIIFADVETFNNW
jgi:hypothetical protein